jgi:hypothetical protein
MLALNWKYLVRFRYMRAFQRAETYIIMTWSVCNGRSLNDSRRERSQASEQTISAYQS